MDRDFCPSDGAVCRMSDDELEAIISKAACKATRETLRHLGMDTSDPISIQKDFAHLRAWREATDDIKKKSIATIISIAIAGICGAVVLAIRAH